MGFVVLFEDCEGNSLRLVRLTVISQQLGTHAAWYSDNGKWSISGTLESRYVCETTAGHFLRFAGQQ